MSRAHDSQASQNSSGTRCLALERRPRPYALGGWCQFRAEASMVAMNSGAQAFSLHSFRDFEPEHDRHERLIIKCADFGVHTVRVQFATEAFTVHNTPLSEKGRESTHRIRSFQDFGLECATCERFRNNVLISVWKQRGHNLQLKHLLCTPANSRSM